MHALGGGGGGGGGVVVKNSELVFTLTSYKI